MKSTQTKVSGAPLPTRTEGIVFSFKAAGLRTMRRWQNFSQGIRTFKPAQEWKEATVIAKSDSPLWTGEDTARMLIAGKIQNIRLASKNLDGIIIPAGQIFSFWKHVGKPSRQKRYARGRELREGCIIPTIGGGICQLSNAIYDAALKAGIEVIERHKHTQIIAGSLAEQDRDATVFWNYVDLKLKAPFAWQIQIKMDHKHLSVRILTAEKPVLKSEPSFSYHAPDAIGDCSRCGRTDCYIHTGDIPLHEHTTWLIIDEEWPEFKLWRKTNVQKGDKFISTKSEEGFVPPMSTKIVNTYSRAVRRYHIQRKDPLPIGHYSRFKRIAAHFAKQLDASDTSLVVPQELLIWLWKAGELRGRQYDVLMTALPIVEIQLRLDEAVKKYPAINTLSDFRAGKELIEAEELAIAGARRLISPHNEILDYYGNKATPLSWYIPDVKLQEKNTSSNQSAPFIIALPSSPLARKGVFELCGALKELPFPTELVIPPGRVETDSVFEGLNVRRVKSTADAISQADLVILPAWVEHHARGLLLSVALKKPVIATPVCGLTKDMEWKPVEPGNIQQLRDSIIEYFEQKDAVI